MKKTYVAQIGCQGIVREFEISEISGKIDDRAAVNVANILVEQFDGSKLLSIIEITQKEITRKVFPALTESEPKPESKPEQVTDAERLEALYITMIALIALASSTSRSRIESLVRRVRLIRDKDDFDATIAKFNQLLESAPKPTH